MNPRNSFRALPALGLLAAVTLAVAVEVGGCGSGSGTSTQDSTTTTPTTREAAVAGPQSSLEKEGSKDRSIREYGVAAGGSTKEALLASMHSFFNALAARDYAEVCAGLTASNRRQLSQFANLKRDGTNGCTEGVSQLLARSAADEAKKAAAARIGKVRIKGRTAFVIFTPKSGVPSYFVMKMEAGAWKAIGLAPGTPVNPTATP